MSSAYTRMSCSTLGSCDVSPIRAILGSLYSRPLVPWAPLLCVRSSLQVHSLIAHPFPPPISHSPFFPCITGCIFTERSVSHCSLSLQPLTAASHCSLSLQPLTAVSHCTHFPHHMSRFPLFCPFHPFSLIDHSVLSALSNLTKPRASVDQGPHLDGPGGRDACG